jgi:hypothetical protein
MVAMANNAPKSLTIRTYDVGFGDCFLLSFHYAKFDRHVLVDFGTMRLPRRKTIKGNYINKIAEAIRQDCGGKLDVVVATHRHRDHISGFARNDGKGPGEIIRSLKPRLVIQPWTEDPKLPKTATGPSPRGYAATLLDMHRVAEQVVTAASGLSGGRFDAVRAQLKAIGEDNIQNPDAVANLRTMAKNQFVYHGANAGLAQILPGVKTTVLGPPTVKQSAGIKTQRSTDQDEFWHLMAGFWKNLAATKRAHNKDAKPLFPRHPTGTLPRAAGWFKYTVMQEQADSMMSIVRMLDKAMNNTSVILLFEIRDKMILFPGDAQYENWMYTLGKKELRKKLERVDLYKVGHHGSLNATPKTLWNGFANKAGARKQGRLKTLLSTEKGVHGSTENKTEVPRRTLFNALRDNSDLTNTEEFAPDALSQMVTLTF